MALKEKPRNKEIWTRNNTVSLAIWTSPWVLSVALAAFGHEMLQKVHLESMGISLGLAVIGGISYLMSDATNVITYEDQSEQR